MAKQMSWTIGLESSRLQVKHAENGREQAFYLNKLFPKWSELTECQQRIVVNGVKQRLADKVATSKDSKLTAGERMAAIQTIWEALIKGEYTTKAAARGPSVTLSKLEEAVLPMAEKGFDAVTISTLLHINIERVQEILEGQEEETTEEEETEQE